MDDNKKEETITNETEVQDSNLDNNKEIKPNNKKKKIIIISLICALIIVLGVTGFIIYKNKNFINDDKKESNKSQNYYAKKIVVESNGQTLKEFTDKEDTQLFLKVDYETSYIKITTTPEDKKSNVKGDGTYELKEGYNTFNIKVSAENTNTLTYVLDVYRDTKKEQQENSGKDNQTNDKDKDSSKVIETKIFGKYKIVISGDEDDEFGIIYVDVYNKENNKLLIENFVISDPTCAGGDYFINDKGLLVMLEGTYCNEFIHKKYFTLDLDGNKNVIFDGGEIGEGDEEAKYLTIENDNNYIVTISKDYNLEIMDFYKKSIKKIKLGDDFKNIYNSLSSHQMDGALVDLDNNVVKLKNYAGYDKENEKVIYQYINIDLNTSKCTVNK